MPDTGLLAVAIVLAVGALAIAIAFARYQNNLNTKFVEAKNQSVVELAKPSQDEQKQQQQQPQELAVPKKSDAAVENVSSSSLAVGSPNSIDTLRSSIKNYLVPISDIKFGRLLGKGTQGEVYLGEWRGSPVAVKKIDLMNVEADIIEEFCGEADIMRRLRHPSLWYARGNSSVSLILSLHFHIHSLSIPLHISDT